MGNVIDIFEKQSKELYITNDKLVTHYLINVTGKKKRQVQLLYGSGINFGF
jgi:hypothetical protein